jgi:succinate dehydrogenase/fumarate reductase-like Fe-S protein
MTKATSISQAELIAALMAEKEKTASLEAKLASASPVKKTKPMVIFTGKSNPDGSAEVAKPTKAQTKALKELENCILGVVHVSTMPSTLANGHFMHTNAQLRQPGVKKGQPAEQCSLTYATVA